MPDLNNIEGVPVKSFNATLARELSYQSIVTRKVTRLNFMTHSRLRSFCNAVSVWPKINAKVGHAIANWSDNVQLLADSELEGFRQKYYCLSSDCFKLVTVRAKTQPVITITKIGAWFEGMRDKAVKFILVNVGEDLTGKVADGHTSSRLIFGVTC